MKCRVILPGCSRDYSFAYWPIVEKGINQLVQVEK